MAGIRDVSIENGHLAALDLADAGHKPAQRRFANAIRPDHPDHAMAGNIERDVVERDRFSVPVRYALDPSDDGVRHWGSFTTSSSGHVILGSVRTKPRPRTPVFTCRWHLYKTLASPRRSPRTNHLVVSSEVSTHS